jgi:hypothetical protein
MAKKKKLPRSKKKSNAAVNDEETYTTAIHLMINEAERTLEGGQVRGVPSRRDLRHFVTVADMVMATIKGRTRLREWWEEACGDKAAMDDLREFIKIMVALGPDFEG